MSSHYNGTGFRVGTLNFEKKKIEIATIIFSSKNFYHQYPFENE